MANINLSFIPLPLKWWRCMVSLLL